MKGTIKVPGIATIDGKIEGVVTADTIYVTANGAINGRTAANHIRVGGELTDTTVANRTLVVESMGKILGSITYADLEIKKGGTLQGDIHKVKDGQSSGFRMQEPEPAPEPAPEPEPESAPPPSEEI